MSNHVHLLAVPETERSLADGDGLDHGVLRRHTSWGRPLGARAHSVAWLPVAFLALGLPATGGQPPQTLEYLPFFVSYAPYAETIWHGVGAGGYWGDGLARGNGGIRGTSNVTLVFAMLVHAYDEGWLSASQRETLGKAGLERAACLDRIRKSWRYLAACHVTGDGHSAAEERKWGRSWQSSLWVGASGLAALLVWDHLDGEIRAMVERVVVDEANRKIAVKPRDGKPGNTAAEENGWDTHAPAIAVALFPKHPGAPKWLRAAQVFAANTYSVRADRASDARLGDERVRDVVCTTNLFDDFTLDNHGFFHPAYLKVSGQEIGEAWAMLALADRRRGTSFAEQFKPYALHHVADTWLVLRRILLPDGEFAYPSGQDWAVHISTDQSYFAFIATALRDPVAALAERRGFTAARWRMRAAGVRTLPTGRPRDPTARLSSPKSKRASRTGRILGATNFEWWWDPILLKRFATAMLHFMVSPGQAPDPAPASRLADVTDTFFFPAVGVFGHRTPRYFASVSTRPRPTGQVIPLGERHLEHPYVTTPRVGSILPGGTIESFTRHTHARGAALVMRYSDGSGAAMIALRDVVLWLSSGTLSPMAIQNDNVTGKGRMVRSAGGSQNVPALEATEPFAVSGTWLNIDGQLGLIAEAGFRYAPAGKYTRRSAAEDLVRPDRGPGGTSLLVAPRVSAAGTERLARAFSVRRSRVHDVVPTTRRTGRRHEVRFRDGDDGPVVVVTVDLGGGTRTIPPRAVSVTGSVHPRYPIRNLADGDPETYAVIRNEDGKGPTPNAPVVLEFSMPTGVAEPRALRIVPRPLYGPRELILEVRRAVTWQKVAMARVGPSGHKDIALGAHKGAERFRLTISRGWDRGEQLSAAPRNTQIAELSFLPSDEAKEEGSVPAVPFELRVVGPGKRN